MARDHYDTMSSATSRFGLPAHPSVGVRSRKSGTKLESERILRQSSRGVPDISKDSSTVSLKTTPKTSFVSTPGAQPPASQVLLQLRTHGRTTTDTKTRISDFKHNTTSKADKHRHQQPCAHPLSLPREKTSDPAQLPRKPIRAPALRDTRPLHKRSGSLGSSSPSTRAEATSEGGLGIIHNRCMPSSPVGGASVKATRAQISPLQLPIIYPELDRYGSVKQSDTTSNVPENGGLHRLSIQNLPAGTPISTLHSNLGSRPSVDSRSPSTKSSASPVFSAYSRDTTPTSISSLSPVCLALNSAGQSPKSTRHQQVSATRAPITKRRAGSFSSDKDVDTVNPNGLAPVRESNASSLSNITTKHGNNTVERKTTSDPRRLQSTSLPSPPSRKSSQKTRNLEERRASQKVVGTQLTGRALALPLNDLQNKSPHMSDTSRDRTDAPARPSRRNNPDIKSQLFSPVHTIQSNLKAISQAAKVAPREPLKTATSRPVVRHNPAMHAVSVVRELKNRTQSSFQKLKTARISQASQVNTQSTNHFKIPFFGTRNVGADSTLESSKYKGQEKTFNKGPVSGTGYEEQIRVGASRRRNESEAALPRNTKEIRLTCTGPPVSDSFLADRINPVIISGGEIIENRNISSELNHPETSRVSQPTAQPKGVSEETSALGKTQGPSLRKRPRFGSRGFVPRRPSECSTSDGSTADSTCAPRSLVDRLAFRRDGPPQTTRLSGNSDPTASSPMTSLDISSNGSSANPRQGEAALLQPVSTSLQGKNRGFRRWNFFRRSPHLSRDVGDQTITPVSAVVQAVGRQSLAFYMSDQSEQEGMEPLSVLKVLQEANVYETAAETADACHSCHPKDSELLMRNNSKEMISTNRSQTLPSGDVKSTIRHSSKIADPPQSNTAKRPRRLLHVGRIPEVVRRTEQQEERSSQDDSPPSPSLSFQTSLYFQGRSLTAINDTDSFVFGRQEPAASSRVPDLTQKHSNQRLGRQPFCRQDPESNASLVPSQFGTEFLSMPTRKYSDVTDSTSTGSSSGANTFVTAAAVIPRLEDPPIEDDIWDEYNDFLGTDIIRETQSIGSMTAASFPPKSSRTISIRKKEDTPPDMALNATEESTSLGSSALLYADDPQMIDNVRSVVPVKKKLPASPSKSPSTRRVRGNKSRVKLRQEAERQSTSSCRSAYSSDCSSSSSNDQVPLAQVHIRTGSITISKWLTFGHTLFSEVRHQLGADSCSTENRSVLVIDGLGNDDWSYYAAETFPAVSIYNLSPRAPLPADVGKSSSRVLQGPENHHQVQYSAHTNKFPFRSKSFDVVVYRFPAAGPEAHYINVLSEARRVLKSEGFIELSILDPDLNNMGNQGRRTIRRLKEQIRQRTPETTFVSTADLMVRLLGRNGFSNIRAARVGLPVASPKKQFVSQKGRAARAPHKNRRPTSLADMMNDDSPMADENITNMVSRVGRWWYTRCYETAAGPQPSGSIWNDNGFLAECEQLGTSLKLMVCCARAPSRTSSS